MDISDNDRDAAVRTMLGEADPQDGPAGQAGVGAVILNRLQFGSFGDSIPQIVHGRNQFEAWSARRKELEGYDKKSDSYQRAGQVFDDLASGKAADPTGGALYYYAPVAQAALGRKPPSFSRSQQTAEIGHHRFYAGAEGPFTPDLLGAWNGSASKNAPAASAMPADAATEPPDLLSSWNAATNKAAPATSAATATLPAAAQPSPTDESAGAWTARLLAGSQGPGLGDKAARLGLGTLRGVGDVADTLAQGISGAGRAGADALSSAGVISPYSAYQVGNWANRIQGDIAQDYNAFNSAAANSPLAQTGRIGGQILGTAPAIGAAGALAAPALASTGPVTGSILGGAGAGGAAAALTSAASDQPLGQQVGMGATVGGALGPLGYGASMLGRGARNLVLGGLDPETAQLAQTARQAFDIPVTAGQMSGSPSARFLDSVLRRLPLTGYAGRTEMQQTAFNRAVSNTFGEDVTKITPRVIQSAKDRIGDVFDDVATRTPVIHADVPFYQNMNRILTDARSVLPQSEVSPIENQMRDIASAIDPNAHTLTGETYQALTRKGAPLDRSLQSKDPNIRYYAGQVREALDDAMQRSAPADAVQDLAQARSQWHALKTVEPLTAAKKAPTGDISPALLGSRPTRNADLQDLAAIGQRFIKEPPSSGTAERLLTMEALKYGAGAAGLGGAYAFDPENFQKYAIGAGLALGGGRAASSALRSNWLANSMIRGGLGTAGGNYPLANLLSRAAPAAALLSRQPNSLPGQ